MADHLREDLRITTDEVMTSAECAEMLGISPGALNARIRRGSRLPRHERDGVNYYSRREVKEYILLEQGEKGGVRL